MAAGNWGRWLAAAMAVTTGCGGLNALRTKAPDPGTREGEWALVRDAATRRAMLYDRFVHRATVTATYLGPKERDARVRRLAEWMGWTDEERAAQVKAEEAEAAKYDDFIVAFYTADRKANDLDAQNSVWRLSLDLGAGEQVVTRDVQVLEPNANVTRLFPYVSPFDDVYRVRFNRVKGGPLDGRTFDLAIASAIGRMELTFGDGAVGPDQPETSPPN
jgi:hypothetical protein